MKQNWTPEDLESTWLLHSPELALLRNKSGATRLGFAVLLKFFQWESRFPEDPGEVPPVGVRHVAGQLHLPEDSWRDYKWEGRAIKYHRLEIRDWCGFREFTLADQEALKGWLIREVIPQEHRLDRLTEFMLQWCRGLRIEPPAAEYGQRILNAALQGHEGEFTQGIFQKLDRKVLVSLDGLLKIQPSEEEPEWTPWQALKADPGKAGVESVKAAGVRLRELKAVGLPPSLFLEATPKLIERYAKRAAVEEPHELRRHAGPLRATLLAAYLYRRSEELTDHLVDLLVETIQKMTKRAEKRVEEEMAGQLQKVPGKIGVLVRMAEASLDSPEGAVKEVIFPVASETLLRQILQEIQTVGPAYQGTVRLILKRSYGAHYGGTPTNAIPTAITLSRSGAQFASSDSVWTAKDEESPLFPGPWAQRYAFKTAV